MSAESGKIFRQKNPWYESWRCAWRRCTDKEHKSYNRYGGRGIKFLLTKEQVSFMWIRDRAFEMDRPRLDRENVDGNYCLNNCRFITEAANLARMHDNSAAPSEWTD